MNIREIEWDVIDFEGVDGNIHPISQCSLRDRDELHARFNQLNARLQAADDTKTLSDFYDGDTKFRWLCDRCLELCKIDPAWVSISQLQALLFAHVEGEEIKPGYLIELNFPTVKRQKTGGKGQSYEEAIAIISSYCESLTEAIDLAKNHPSGQLFRILEARRKQSEEQAKELKEKASGKKKAVKLTPEQKEDLRRRFTEKEAAVNA